MTPLHPNQLLENALAQLFKRLLMQQQAAFDSWRQSYSNDNQALNDLVNSLTLAINELKQPLMKDSDFGNGVDSSGYNSRMTASPLTDAQLTELLRHNQQLAEQVSTLSEQLQQQHDQHQQTIQGLTSQVATLVQKYQDVCQLTERLIQENHQLREQNQSVVLRLNEWIGLYQLQDSKMSSLMRLYRKRHKWRMKSRVVPLWLQNLILWADASEVLCIN